jgi:hypothetical protein
VRPIFRKLRVKFGICTNSGNVCFFSWRPEIYLSLKLDGSMVWYSSPNTLGGGWFDLGTIQAANRVVQRFGILVQTS